MWLIFTEDENRSVDIVLLQFQTNGEGNAYRPFQGRSSVSFHPFHAEKMPRLLLISCQWDYLIRIFDRNSHINDKQCRSRSVGFFRSGSTLFAKTGHVVFSKRRINSSCFSGFICECLPETSLAVLFYSCVSGFLCSFCLVIVCFSSLLHLVPREGCASDYGISWLSSYILSHVRNITTKKLLQQYTQ